MKLDHSFVWYSCYHKFFKLTSISITFFLSSDVCKIWEMDSCKKWTYHQLHSLTIEFTAHTYINFKPLLLCSLKRNLSWWKISKCRIVPYLNNGGCYFALTSFCNPFFFLFLLVFFIKWKKEIKNMSNFCFIWE